MMMSLETRSLLFLRAPSARAILAALWKRCDIAEGGRDSDRKRRLLSLKMEIFEHIAKENGGMSEAMHGHCCTEPGLAVGYRDCESPLYAWLFDCEMPLYSVTVRQPVTFYSDHLHFQIDSQSSDCHFPCVTSYLDSNNKNNPLQSMFHSVITALVTDFHSM